MITPKDICPHCGYHHDTITAVNSDKKIEPKEGDLSICVGCGEPAKFVGDAKGLRTLTADEYDTLPRVAKLTMHLIKTTPRKGK